MGLASGKQPHNYGKSPFLMGKSTISMAIFNSYGTPSSDQVAFYQHGCQLPEFVLCTMDGSALLPRDPKRGMKQAVLRSSVEEWEEDEAQAAKQWFFMGLEWDYSHSLMGFTGI